MSDDQLPNIKPTWFIDPPYNNAAGKKYATSTVNYTHLAEWCRSRKGQTIVCENAGADWLPFKTLTTQRQGIHFGTADEKTAGEVVWTQETEPIGLWAHAESPTLQPAALPMTDRPEQEPSSVPNTARTTDAV